MSAARTFKTRIDLPADRRQKLIALLNQHLADTFDLYSQIKQAHWNVKGTQFYQLHELFDDLADQVEDQVMKSPSGQWRSGARRWAPSAWLPGPRA
jgi:starvation-inducible DNA-binding protein